MCGSSAEGNGVAGALDHVAGRQLAAAAGLHLAVHADVARLEQAAGGPAGLAQVDELEQLAEPDAALAHLDVHGGHATTPWDGEGPRRGRRGPSRCPRSDGADGLRLRATLALGDVELHALVLVE